MCRTTLFLNGFIILQCLEGQWFSYQSFISSDFFHSLVSSHSAKVYLWNEYLCTWMNISVKNFPMWNWWSNSGCTSNFERFYWISLLDVLVLICYHFLKVWEWTPYFLDNMGDEVSWPTLSMKTIYNNR